VAQRRPKQDSTWRDAASTRQNTQQSRESWRGGRGRRLNLGKTVRLNSSCRDKGEEETTGHEITLARTWTARQASARLAARRGKGRRRTGYLGTARRAHGEA
jgi:hypothetical protein